MADDYKYCTKRMALKAAKTGLESAIGCSRDKWWFFGNCDEKQMSRISVDKLGYNCSLCAFNKIDDFISEVNCNTCLLKKHCNQVYDTSYMFWQAYSLYGTYKTTPSKANFKKFQAKARKLARVIGRLK